MRPRARSLEAPEEHEVLEVLEREVFEVADEDIEVIEEIAAIAGLSGNDFSALARDLDDFDRTDSVRAAAACRSNAGLRVLTGGSRLVDAAELASLGRSERSELERAELERPELERSELERPEQSTKLCRPVRRRRGTGELGVARLPDPAELGDPFAAPEGTGTGELFLGSGRMLELSASGELVGARDSQSEPAAAIVRGTPLIPPRAPVLAPGSTIAGRSLDIDDAPAQDLELDLARVHTGVRARLLSPRR